MFKKTPEKKTEPEVAAPAPVLALPKKVSTIISAGCSFAGEFNLKDDIQVDGVIDGNVTVNGDFTITVTEGGCVNGNITAAKVVVEGSVKGDINATRLHLTAKANVEGNISYGTVRVDEGSTFNGAMKRKETTKVSAKE